MTGSTLKPKIRKQAATDNRAVPTAPRVIRSTRQLPLGMFNPFLYSYRLSSVQYEVNFVTGKVKMPSHTGFQHVPPAAVSFVVIIAGGDRFIHSAVLAETYATAIIAAHLAGVTVITRVFLGKA